ncbi:MAG: hypothetical protein QY318_00845 [Candidatus Dojkabacteria bacterium]|nr:MAG: hypothetical protein QY318_00845 [Candidatus Dojkabacteria bacterium]
MPTVEIITTRSDSADQVNLLKTLPEYYQELGLVLHEKAPGYLSTLITHSQNLMKELPDGVFVPMYWCGTNDDGQSVLSRLAVGKNSLRIEIPDHYALPTYQESFVTYVSGSFEQFTRELANQYSESMQYVIKVVRAAQSDFVSAPGAEFNITSTFLDGFIGTLPAELRPSVEVLNSSDVEPSQLFSFYAAAIITGVPSIMNLMYRAYVDFGSKANAYTMHIRPDVYPIGVPNKEEDLVIDMVTSIITENFNMSAVKENEPVYRILLRAADVFSVFVEILKLPYSEKSA